MIARTTEKTMPQANHDKQHQPPSLDVEDEEDEDRTADEDEPIKVMEEVGNFEEVVVWGHEALPGKDDAFVRGMGEWIGFAEAMHSSEQPSDAT
jgi:ribonuclease H2 subunit C